VEWDVLMAATVAAWLTAPDKANLAGHVIVAMLSFAMGIQNAMVRCRGTDTVRHRLAVAADEHRLQFGNDPAAFRRSSVEIAPFAFGIGPDWIVWRAMAANLKPMAADPGQSPL